jgi:malate synthase
MEDAATAEISRAQVWQWLHHGVTLADGRKVTAELYSGLLAEEVEKIKTMVGAETFAAGQYQRAIELFNQLATASTFEEFLTLGAYQYLE